jgi:uracil-DNA glycosylase
MARADDVLEELGLKPIYKRKARVASVEARPPGAARAAAPAVDARAHRHTPKPAAALGDRASHIAGLSWEALIADIAQCTACALCKTRTNTVPGTGAPNASWLIVGEAPGETEDETGMPFVGRGGQLLDNMLKSVGRSRAKNVFIANTLKCRPPGNRNPEPDELAACAPYIKRQIALMQPKMIMAVGKFAAQTVTGSQEPIGVMRTKTYQYESIPVRVTYHPAYLLRSPGEKAKAWDDLLAAQKLFGSD